MRNVIILGSFFFVFSASIFGQGTDLGTIRGTVTDSTGGVLPKAAIEILDVATNISSKLTSGSEGSYEAPGLRSGTYKVTVLMQGFNTHEVKTVVLRGGETLRIDVVMQVRGSADTIVVSSEAPLIATESPSISATLDGQAILDLPRDSRDIYSFLYVNPNITQADADGSFKFIGSQSYGASFSLDGQRSNGGIFGQPTASQPSLETVGELTVLSNNFTAEYAGIANVRVTTKRGTADLHGSLFYNNKNAGLAAWDLRDKIGQAAFLPNAAQQNYPNPVFNLNEFGGSFGGRIPKVKNMFFFLAYERRYSNAPVNLRDTTLAHPSLWVGDFSGLRDTNKPLVPAAVNLTAAEVANNTVGGLGLRFTRLPSRLLNPVTQSLINNYFPKVSTASPINSTNGRLVNYFSSVPGMLVRNLGTLRIDKDFTARDKMYAVYNAQSQNSQNTAVLGAFTGLGLTLNERTNETLSLSETHLVGTNIVNEVRGGFNRQPTFRRSNTTLRQFLTTIGFDSSDIAAYGAVVSPQALDTYGHPAINFGTGFRAFGNGGRNTYRPLDQNLLTFGDTITWIKKRHTIKAGADFVRNAAIDGFTSGRGNPRGLINYTGPGPDAFTRFLIGLPANTVSSVNQFRPPMDVHNWEQGFFLQDDFRVNSRLTLYLGLRYELLTPFIENNDLLVNFDPSFSGPNGKKGRFVVPSQSTLSFLDSRIVNYGVVTADAAGVSRSLVNTDKNNLAVRLGLAYRLNDKTVLRGGYGTFYPTTAAQGIRDPIATNAFQQGLTKADRPAGPLSGWPGVTHGFSPLTGGVQNAISGFPSANAVPFNLQSPRIEQYNVTAERELGWNSAIRVSYLGTRMNGLISGQDLNLIAPNGTPFGTSTGDGVTACDPSNGDCDLSPADRARLPFPQLGDYLTSFGNIGRGKSNAFQLEVNRRYARGLTFNFSYTLLDQKTSAPDTGNSSLGGTVYNQFKPDADYATDAFISRHRFVAYGAYQTPYGKGRQFGAHMPRWAEAMVGSWDLSWQMFIKSGTGFTPYWFCDNCGPAFPGNVASSSIDATGGFTGTTFRPLVNGTPNVVSGDRIFNPDAFAPPPFGANTLDDPNIAKRNILRGPGTYGINLGVRKVFRLGERVRADLGADFNNLFNHPLKSPNSFDIGNLGSFTIKVDPKTLQPALANVITNPDFGRLLTSYSQEGIDSRRTVRLKLRVTF